MSITYLEQLAAAARPINEADFGSERQIDAENHFYDTLDQHTVCLPIEIREAYDAFCAKATVDERITEGLRLAELAEDF